MKYRVLKTGDLCPFCGQPIRLTDPDALRLLAAIDARKEAGANAAILYRCSAGSAG